MSLVVLAAGPGTSVFSHTMGIMITFSQSHWTLGNIPGGEVLDSAMSGYGKSQETANSLLTNFLILVNSSVSAFNCPLSSPAPPETCCTHRASSSLAHLRQKATFTKVSLPAATAHVLKWAYFILNYKAIMAAFQLYSNIWQPGCMKNSQDDQSCTST